MEWASEKRKYSANETNELDQFRAYRQQYVMALLGKVVHDGSLSVHAVAMGSTNPTSDLDITGAVHLHLHILSMKYFVPVSRSPV